MTTQAYVNWVADGRPFKLATPITEYRDAFKAAGWPITSLGTLGDTAHLQADHPQDHCPFSATGWPMANEYPYVCAFDAGHFPGTAHDMAPVVAHWLTDARAGKTPWVKYIVWQGHIYDSRAGWSPQPASDHYDHAHMSIRTDWTHRSIGTYSPVGKDDTMFCAYGDGNSGTPSDKVKAYQRLLLIIDPACLPKFGPDGGFGDETASAGARIIGGDGRTYGPEQYAALFAKIGAIGGPAGKDGKDGKDAPVPTELTFAGPLVAKVTAPVTPQ